MNEFSAIDYPIAKPLATNACEMANSQIKLIFAHRGSFNIAGCQRTAFIVGSRYSPIEVGYSADAGCTEFSLPPWVATAVLGVSGCELSQGVYDVSDLPNTPFLSAVQRSDPSALDIARLGYASWSAGRGTSDARIAQQVWHTLRADPGQRLDFVAKKLGLSARRVRAAVRSETGMTPAQWRRLMRLEKACHAILKIDQSLSMVAFAAGYADQSHMNRDLSELAGMTPSQLRRVTVSG